MTRPDLRAPARALQSGCLVLRGRGAAVLRTCLTSCQHRFLLCFHNYLIHRHSTSLPVAMDTRTSLTMVSMETRTSSDLRPRLHKHHTNITHIAAEHVCNAHETQLKHSTVVTNRPKRTAQNCWSHWFWTEDQCMSLSTQARFSTPQAHQQPTVSMTTEFVLNPSGAGLKFSSTSLLIMRSGLFHNSSCSYRENQHFSNWILSLDMYVNI